MTENAFVRLGVASKFPTIKRFLSMYVQGLPNWENEELVRLKRYAFEGGFKYSSLDGFQVRVYSLFNAEIDLTCVGRVMRWRGIQGALKGQPDFQVTLHRAAAYRYWALRALHRFDRFMLQDFRSGGRPEYSGMMRLRSAVSGLAHVFLLGWSDEARALIRYILTALPDGAYFDADQTSHPRAQFFALRLLCEHFGLAMSVDRAFIHDEPIYEFLLEQWRCPDPLQLTHALLAALDRHTQQSVRAKSRGPATDFTFDEDWYFPYEVLLVLKLRELAGLANPPVQALEHPLTATVLGQLPQPTPMYSDPTLDGVIQRMRAEFPDL